MPLKSHWKWGAFVGALCLISGVVYFYSVQKAQVESPPQKATVGGSPVEIEGLKFTNYRGRDVQSQVKADQLIVLPRQIGYFQLQSVNEALITKFRLEVFKDMEQGENSSAGAPTPVLPDELSEGIKGLASIKGAGRITRVTINGVEIASFADNKPQFVLHAQVGIFDARQKQLNLEKVGLLQPSTGSRIVTDRAFWNKKINAFEIPGKYTLQNEKGTQEGTRIYVDMDFRMIFDKASIKPKAIATERRTK